VVLAPQKAATMDLLSPGKDPVNGTQPAGVGARYDRTFEDGQGESTNAPRR